MSAHTDNQTIINAPMDFVWERSNDVANWPNLFSEYGSADILHTDGNRVVFRLAMHPDENGIVWSWVSERVMDPETHTTVSRRVEPGPFKYMFLYWEYTQTDDGVRLRWVQDFEMKPAAPVNDATMRERINTNSATQLARIKGLLEADAALLAGTKQN